MTAIMMQLTALEKELERTKEENPMLREVLITQKDDEGETVGPEKGKSTGAPEMPPDDAAEAAGAESMDGMRLDVGVGY